MSEQGLAGKAELHTHVTEESIALMVDRFYASVQEHPTLGPVFNARLEGRWDSHLDQMKAFWSSVLLMSGRYEGRPLRAHFDVEGLEKRHFADWLGLFRETLEGVYVQDVAEGIHARSRQIAQRFSIALFDLQQ